MRLEHLPKKQFSHMLIMYLNALVQIELFGEVIGQLLILVKEFKNGLKLQIQFWQNYLLMKHQKSQVLMLKEFIKFQSK